MVYTCFICKWRSDKVPKRSFHRFPRDNAQKQKWLDALGRSDTVVGKGASICSLHFTRDCFRYGLVNGKEFLKEHSLPSLNVLNEDICAILKTTKQQIPMPIQIIKFSEPTTQIFSFLPESECRLVPEATANVYNRALSKNNIPLKNITTEDSTYSPADIEIKFEPIEKSQTAKTSSLKREVQQRLDNLTSKSLKNIAENSKAFPGHSKKRPHAADEVQNINVDPDQNIKTDPDAISETPFESVFITGSYELPTVNESIPSVGANSFPASNSQSCATPMNNTVQPVALCKVDRTTSLANNTSRSPLPATSSTISNQPVLPVNEIRPVKLKSSCSEICRIKQKRLGKRLVFATREIKSLKLMIQKQMKSMGSLRKAVKRLKNTRVDGS